MGKNDKPEADATGGFAVEDLKNNEVADQDRRCGLTDVSGNGRGVSLLQQQQIRDDDQPTHNPSRDLTGSEHDQGVDRLGAGEEPEGQSDPPRIGDVEEGVEGGSLPHEELIIGDRDLIDDLEGLGRHPGRGNGVTRHRLPFYASPVLTPSLRSQLREGGLSCAMIRGRSLVGGSAG